jgi:hypothetical protein
LRYREEGKNGKNHSYNCCSPFAMVSLAQKVINEIGEDRKQTLVYVIVRDVLLQVVTWSFQVKTQNEYYCKYLTLMPPIWIHSVM